ncbi:MAG: ABC transporter ATP-binding protein [Candidatus Rokubacteria bacterium]|nr:ABC transporter ATP-binding protein [Candidatus Rokubacteria bacterium]
MPDVHDDGEGALGRAFDRRLVGRLWGAARAHHRLIYGSLLLFPLIAALELAQPYLLKVAIDEHILRGDWAGLTRVAGVYVVVLAALYALRMAEAYLMHVTGQRVMHDLRATLFAHVVRLDARFFDRTPVGRLMTRVLYDAEAVSDAFTSGLSAIVADVVTLAGVVAIMLWMDWHLALVTFSIVPVLAVAAGYFRLRARDAYRTVRRRLARLNGFLQESLQGMAVVQLFAREAHERERFHELNASYRRALFGSTIFEATLYSSVEAIGAIAVALLLWYGGAQIAAGTLTFGALVAFLQYTNRFFLPIRDLGAKYTVMQAAMASAERIFELLDERPAITSPAVAPRGGETTSVTFDRVWFAYDTRARFWRDDTWVLRECSFEVAPGEHVAIVGATGEGKSTCARLLNRSYDVSRGRVLVGGLDVREWDLERLRRHVGLIFQDTVLFTGSVEANLRLGATADGHGPSRLGDGGAVDAATLERAVRMANASTFIEALPGRFDAPLSERGANISYGQRQLLAIARALVYNPAILVLDEATSSVDPESEALIQDAMKRLLAGRTTITIAHRLATVHGADRILVLHRGRVHEAGTHADLVRHGGLYARLWELQTSR